MYSKLPALKKIYLTFNSPEPSKTKFPIRIENPARWKSKPWFQKKRSLMKRLENLRKHENFLVSMENFKFD